MKEFVDMIARKGVNGSLVCIFTVAGLIIPTGLYESPAGWRRRVNNSDTSGGFHPPRTYILYGLLNFGGPGTNKSLYLAKNIFFTVTSQGPRARWVMQ